MGYDHRDLVLITHAAMGGILAMVIWPGGAIVGRYLRTFYPRWVRLHYIIQAGLGVPFVVIVFSLGRWHVGDARFNKVHHRVGLALLILALLQSIYGWLIHIKTLKKWFPRTGPRSIARYLHPIAGIAIMVIGFVEVYLGLKLWKRPGHVPHGAYVAWGVLLAFWLALYLTGFVLLPRQWRAGKADLDVHGEIAGREKPQDGGHERLGSTDTQAAVA